MDCPGDKFAPGADGDFSGASNFDFSGDWVELGIYWVDHPFEYFGSVSGAVPQ